MSVYVHSPSPYFIVKKWLAGILVLHKKKKKIYWKFSFTLDMTRENDSNALCYRY